MFIENGNSHVALIEREKEMGSSFTYLFIYRQAKLLKCDMTLIKDTEMLEKNQPIITLGLRGLAFLNLKLVTLKKKLHSGYWGEIAPNPILDLIPIINHLDQKDAQI